VLALACPLLLVACEKKLSNANLQQVRPDMTTKEVESILGHPNEVVTSPDLKSTEVTTLPVTRYVYEQNGRKVRLTFVGDRLATGGVDGSFEP